MNFDSEILWGWNPFFESFYLKETESLKDPCPLRVVSELSGVYRVFCPRLNKEFFAKVSGKLRWAADDRESLPVVGDWVFCDLAVESKDTLRIEGVLPRKSLLKRKAPTDRGGNQIFAANVEEVWIVSSLDNDFSESRMDRILSLVSEGGAIPRMVLSKIDLVSAEDQSNWLLRLADRFPGIPVHCLSNLDPESVAELRKNLKSALSFVVVGSSGVGKSTLINGLLGRHYLKTQAAREDDSKGRHTTTNRELLQVPGGALLIDTPGVREWQLTDDSEVSGGFQDVEALAVKCRFSDCKHAKEPGCQVQAALANGSLDHGRWNSYLKLHREIQHQSRKGSKALQSEQKKKWKKIHQEVRKKNRRPRED